MPLPPLCPPPRGVGGRARNYKYLSSEVETDGYDDVVVSRGACFCEWPPRRAPPLFFALRLPPLSRVFVDTRKREQRPPLYIIFDYYSHIHGRNILFE